MHGCGGQQTGMESVNAFCTGVLSIAKKRVFYYFVSEFWQLSLSGSQKNLVYFAERAFFTHARSDFPTVAYCVL